jgi:alkylation response protein AidB-like acyl-CoA dehydrogenase
MEFVFTPEQDEFRLSLRRFLADRSPETEVRRLMDTESGYDPAVWAQLTQDLGLTALFVPEVYGGLGFSFLETSIALEEVGRVLLCAPLLSAVVAATALLSAGDSAACAELLPGIAGGSVIATIAYMEGPHDWAGSSASTSARQTPEGWTLTGTKRFVLDGATADLHLVFAHVDGDLRLFAVDAAAAGIERSALPTMDLTRKLADVTYDATPAREIDTSGSARDVLSHTLDVAATALAAEQVGGSQQVLEMSVEYAKIRVQFGRPIGSFQAIKHKCADMFLAVESARSAAQHAAWAVADQPEELPVAASIAKAHCSEAYAANASENIQIHGGIGFTWEHPAHLYFKRAKSSALMFGDAVHHRDLVARRLGLTKTA